MRTRSILLGTFLVAWAASAAAQSATATFNANLAPVARLEFSDNSLTFPDADPDTVPLVPAASGPLTITAKARATQGAPIMLSVQASGDLRSSLDTIPASAITWTGSGPGFVSGTLSASAPQLVGTWTSSGVHVGSQNFLFRNSWSYPTGTYTATLLYTLSSP